MGYNIRVSGREDAVRYRLKDYPPPPPPPPPLPPRERERETLGEEDEDTKVIGPRVRD